MQSQQEAQRADHHEGHGRLMLVFVSRIPSQFVSQTADLCAGPRHLAFHPKLPVVWVLNELDSTTVTDRWEEKDGTLRPTRVITTLPPELTGLSTAAEFAVTPDGRFV